ETMGDLVKVFKPDPFVLWLIKGMMLFGLLVALAGFAAHHAAISCLVILHLQGWGRNYAVQETWNIEHQRLCHHIWCLGDRWNNVGRH
ncbi:unnamed protein product, partial [marine sediment metagenome]